MFSTLVKGPLECSLILVMVSSVSFHFLFSSTIIFLIIIIHVIRLSSLFEPEVEQILFSRQHTL